MKKLLMAAAASAVFLTPLAQAQSSNFEGFGIGLGITSADTTTELVNGGSINSTNADSNAMLQLQYTAAVSDVFLVGMGATATNGELKAGTVGLNQFKVKDAYSIYVAPGYAFNSDWMGYGKLAYLNASLKDSTGRSYSFDNGWGYGVGVQAMFGKNWFGQLEYMVNQYNDRSAEPGYTLKLRSNVYALSAGYKF